MSRAVTAILGLLLVGCPTPVNEHPVETAASPALPVLASCEILQNWQREGDEAWHRAIKSPDGTYTLCGEPFHRGPVEGDCILPPVTKIENGEVVDNGVMVEGQTEDYAHHRVVERWCLDAINGGINGQCSDEHGWNCQDVWDKAGSSPGCTAIPARRTGTCEAMWGVQ